MGKEHTANITLYLSDSCFLQQYLRGLFCMQSTVLGFLKIQINDRTCAVSNMIATSHMGSLIVTISVIHNSAARAPFRMLRGRPHAPIAQNVYFVVQSSAVPYRVLSSKTSGFPGKGKGSHSRSWRGRAHTQRCSGHPLQSRGAWGPE